MREHAPDLIGEHSAEWSADDFVAAAGGMRSQQNTTQTGLRSETAQRFVAANRKNFDSYKALPSAANCRPRAIEASLIGAWAEVVELQNRLHAIEASRSWRLTGPLRWAIEALQKVLTPQPAVIETPKPPTPPIALPYVDWIRTQEIPNLATLVQPGPGHQAIRPQRLGVVILAPKGYPLQADCPPGCTILVLEEERLSAPCIRPESHILRHPIPAGFTPADAVNLSLDILDSDMLCFLDGQEQWAPGALSLAASVLAQYPHLDLLFADEDWLDAEGQRERPFFKPGWDPELQRGRDLVGPFAFFRTALVRAATVSDDAAWHYDLANQVAAATRPERIHHIPAILCHRTALPPGHAQAMQAAVAAQLERDGVVARVASVPGHPEWKRIIYDISGSEPLVSIIIPTRDRASLLSTSAKGVLNHTAYPRLELLIVDNGTVEPDALALLDTLAADDRVRIVRRPGAFNWSALNNAAADEAAGDVLVLLNNDIAMLQPDWLTELVSHALQPSVGAVGAKLLYQDGRLQHAGLTTDHAGIPRHLFRYAPGDSTGSYGMLGLAREVWAVTGACLAIPRRAFFDVGGLNEALPVAYNDVDLCLRLTAHGYRIIWTPWSVVEHREMASRPPDHSADRRDQAKEERNRLLRDWGSLVMHDPFLNPNLHLVDEHPCLQSTPALMV